MSSPQMMIGTQAQAACAYDDDSRLVAGSDVLCITSYVEIMLASTLALQPDYNFAS